MRRDLRLQLYDGDAGIAGGRQNLSASPHIPLRYTSGALGGTRDFAARNRSPAMLCELKI
jgi:hypothetical protein